MAYTMALTQTAPVEKSAIIFAGGCRLLATSPWFYSTNVYAVDPATYQWTTVGHLPVSSCFGYAALNSDNTKVYVISGRSNGYVGNFTYLQGYVVIDVSQVSQGGQVVHNIVSPPGFTPRQYLTAATDLNGNIYVYVCSPLLLFVVTISALFLLIFYLFRLFTAMEEQQDQMDSQFPQTGSGRLIPLPLHQHSLL